MDTPTAQSSSTQDVNPFWGNADYKAHFSAEEIEAIRQTHDQATSSFQQG